MITKLVNWLLARALLATFHDKDYRPWIGCARFVARLTGRREA